MKNKKLWIILSASALALIAAAFLIFGGKGGGSGTYDNLIINGDFESVGGDGMPQGWYADAYISTIGYTEYDISGGRTGSGAHIVNHALNDARFAQTVSVSPDTLYRLHGYVKASAEGGRGANLSVEGVAVFSDSVYDTQGEWQEVALYGRTGSNQHYVDVFARLGGYSGEATGEAWFDDVTLCRVDAVPSGYVETQWYAAQSVSDTGAGAPSGAANVALWLSAMAYAAIFALLIGVMRRSAPLDDKKKDRRAIWTMAALLVAALGVRLALALSVYGYDIDVGDFISWANRMAQVGPSQFYLDGGFSDYPPGYMLILWLVGGVGQLFGGVSVLLIKMPSILCDLAIVWLLYVEGKKRASENVALSLAALFAFSPLALTAGAAWGQADSVMTLLLLLTVIFAMRRKWRVALPIYVFAALVKPQALMFGPIGLLALIYGFVKNRGDKQALTTLRNDALIGVGVSVAVFAAVVTPFSIHQGGVGWLFELYGKTMTHYNYVAVNSCNLYFLLGRNWVAAASGAPLNDVFKVLALLALPLLTWRYVADKRRNARIACIAGGVALLALSFIPMSAEWFSYNALGTGVIVLSVAMCGYWYWRGGDIKRLPLLGATLLTMLFTCGTMMHERYLFPAVALLLLAYLMEKDRRILYLMLLVTVSSFLNVGCVLDRNIRIGGSAGHLWSPAYGITSDMTVMEIVAAVLGCASCMMSVYVSHALCRKDARALALEPAAAAQARVESDGKKTPQDKLKEIDEEMTAIAERASKRRMSKWDYILMLSLTAIYCVGALVNLGSTKAPQTYWVSTAADEQIVFDLGEKTDFEMLYYGGIHWSDYHFGIEVSDDGQTWTHEGSDTPYPARMEDGNCFQWQYLVYGSTFGDSHSYTSEPRALSARYVRLTCNTIGLTLFEVIFRDPITKQAIEGITVTDTRTAYDANALIDEADAFEGEPGWYNSMYFDEIYHARTAYEHLHGLRTYETTHPPLGKVFMSLCVSVFGMTPFGWRFAGAMAGVLMLPAMYLIGRLLFKKRWLAPLPLLLMMFDCMHFTQTRIATIDSFAVLFIIWATYFMLRWLFMDYYGEKRWKTFLPLMLSGLFMGLAAASKWTGCYAGLGLGVMFFYGVWQRYRLHRYVKTLMAESPKPSKRMKQKRALPAYSSRLTTCQEDGGKRLMYNILSCVLFFAVIPLIIYYLSYIPYFRHAGGVTVRRVIDAAESMLDYHAEPGRGMDHYFYSPWYEWPLSIRPMWYYSTTFSPEGFGSTIATIGNPAVWWVGFIGLLATVTLFVKQRVDALRHRALTRVWDTRPALLLIGFAAQFVPWTLVPRGIYIYHYFPSVPFIILCTTLCLDRLAEKHEKAAKIITIALTVAAVALFVAFFPYSSGVTVSTGWLDAMKWFPNWLYY